jgi:hypothetical protein
VKSRNFDGRIKTYWKTDQADKTRLRTIVETEFDGPLDLLIDDASHLYRQTRASFEALFPLLVPGGLSIIEIGRGTIGLSSLLRGPPVGERRTIDTTGRRTNRSRRDIDPTYLKHLSVSGFRGSRTWSPACG